MEISSFCIPVIYYYLVINMIKLYNFTYIFSSIIIGRSDNESRNRTKNGSGRRDFQFL
ncbi:hypothetical protein CLOM621_06259 [Clostridium sp. M62/1]|nr:hypothetical protein CLOM621_06259 [Clostridium sp. M62/1]